MEIYKLKKPNVTFDDEKIFKLIKQFGDKIFDYVAKASTPEYLYWDKLRFKSRPKGMTAEEYWSIIKFGRKYSFNRVNTIVKDKNSNIFTRLTLPNSDYVLHEIDLGLGGMLESGSDDDLISRRKFILSGIREEAIASSQLEGANTTRKAAKQMIIEKRKPANRAEQMISNNYRAMVDVEEKLRHQPLNIDTLLELHATLVMNTSDSSDIGRLRKDSDDIIVDNPITNIIYHIPPPEKFLKKEIKRFLSYANDKEPDTVFTHPVIKAIILHFWFAYLHPFTDGNGRMARIIFYWYLLRKKYWAFSYMPLSRVIKSSPAQYRDAYLYSEQDDNDLTYFIDYNLRKIIQAKQDFESYMKRKLSENRKIALITRDKYQLNDRQIQLLKYLYKNKGVDVTIKTHSHIYGITRLTARKDLEGLERQGFLISQKIGRERPFRATDKITELFK